MKKWIKKVVAGVVVLSSSIGLAGCNAFKDEPSQEGYEFKNYEDSYLVNDKFSIIGTKLRITDKKGNTEEIAVTEDMIKQMPDMSTAGTKTVIIEYNGVEYSFTITIENRTNEQLLANLQRFLSKYESNKDSLIEATVSTNLQAKYLGDIANIDEKEAITLLSQMFDNDQLLNALYNSLFDAVVQGSFDLDESYIINSNELKAKLDTLKVLGDAKESITNFDLRTYLINLILPHTDAYYINNVSDYISKICQIKSITGKLAINDVISRYYYKLKNFESFEILDAYTELLNEINVHTVNPVIKEATKNLNSLEPELLLHMLSNMVEKQWLNYGYVMSTDNYAKYEMEDIEAEFESSTLANELIKQQASADKLIVYNFENAIKDLANCTSIDTFKNIVLTGLDTYTNYASKIIDITETLKSNNIVLVMEFDGYYSAKISGTFYYNAEDVCVFEPDYDDEIEFYTTSHDYSQKYYNDIYELGFVATVEKNALVEELFKYFDYPEENKQEAIDNIYAILNSELKGEDLYLAIADVLFPNGANEHFEEVKNIVKSYLKNGLISAIEENKIVEKLIDYIAIYPEENKQEAINTIYSIIKGEKSGKDLYLAIVDLLTPYENDYYIDYACEYINKYLSIESVAGQDEIRTLITKYFEYLNTATEFDLREAYSEILTAIRVHSTNEIVKTATKDLESLELEQLIHIVSDVTYTMQLETVKIATTGTTDYVWSDYQLVESQEAQDLINRYATNVKNSIRAYEDAIYNLINARRVEELFDIAFDCVKATNDYYSESIEIIEILEANKWVLGEEYIEEYYDGSHTRFCEYYYLEEEVVYNYETDQWTYVWVGYNNELEWYNEYTQITSDIYNSIDIIKSLIYEPQEAIDKLLEDYKQEIVDLALEICYDYLGVEPNSYMSSDLEELFINTINDYLSDEFDKEKLLIDIESIINTYATNETKTILNVGYMLYNALNYDESVDYNEVFKDITLPNQVQSIDYNKFMSQLMNKDSYEIFRFNNIEVEYITDSTGNIVAEKLTLKIDVDFDVLISSLKGDVTFTLMLDFEPDYK